MTNFLEKNYKIFITIILGFMLTVSLLNAWNDGAIFDETAHIPAGYTYVKYRDMRLNPEHPPLIKDLSGLFVLPINPKMDLSKDYWEKDVNGQWDAGRDLLWLEGNDADKIIFWSRIPIVLLSLILGIFIFRWAREMAGIVAGLFALILYAFDPNILGHNHFVTTDIGIAAFITFSFYYYLKFIKNPSGKNILMAGIFLGLVQLAKFSSILIFPVLALVTIIYPFLMISPLGENDDWKYRIKKFGQYLYKGALVFIISIIVVWGVYAANNFRMPQGKLAQTIEYYFPWNDNSAKAKMTGQIAHQLNSNTLTRPLSEYFLGIAMVFKRVEGGNGAYFMEQVSGKAFPAYFPTVFVLKEPLPMLFLMLIALILGITGFIIYVKRYKEGAKCSVLEGLSTFARNNITELSLFSFIILYSYISVTGNLNIGFRHLFPILPFAYILTAKSIFTLIKKVEKPGHHTWGVGILILTALLITDTLSAYPAYMSYFNQLAGGPKNGYRYVTDSNADWGQDIKRLKTWIDSYNNRCATSSFPCPVTYGGYVPEALKPIDKIRINYFGGGDIKYYFGDMAIDWWDSRKPIEPGWYAISTNYLMGSIYDKEKKDEESYRWIKNNNIQPVYQVGTSIFIYYIRTTDLN